MASRSSPSEKNVWLRSGAMTQRSTCWTKAVSALALSLGARGRAGSTAVP